MRCSLHDQTTPSIAVTISLINLAATSEDRGNPEKQLSHTEEISGKSSSLSFTKELFLSDLLINCFFMRRFRVEHPLVLLAWAMDALIAVSLSVEIEMHNSDFATKDRAWFAMTDVMLRYVFSEFGIPVCTENLIR